MGDHVVQLTRDALAFLQQRAFAFMPVLPGELARLFRLDWTTVPPSSGIAARMAAALVLASITMAPITVTAATAVTNQARQRTATAYRHRK